MDPLTKTEKAYFDTIKQVAGGTRPEDLRLSRMQLDGKPVAVVTQRVIDTDTAQTVGFMPLAILLDPNDVDRLRGPAGETPEAVDPDGVEGAG